MPEATGDSLSQPEVVRIEQLRRFVGAIALVAILVTFSPAWAVVPTTQVVAKTGDAVPGGGQFSSFALEGPALNEIGQVAFMSFLTQTFAGHGVFRSDGTTTNEIVRSGQSAPDGGTFSDISGTVLLNDGGEVGFLAGGGGVYRGNGGTPVRLGTASAFPRFGFNVSGHASTYDGNQVRRGDGQSTTVIATAGQPTPGPSGTFFGVFGASMNDAGQVAFFATIANATGGTDENEGLYRGDGSTQVEVAREGMPTPTGVGVYNTVGDPKINNAGRTAFFATLRGPGTDANSDWGLFAVDANGASHELVRTGQSAPGGGTLTSSLATFAHSETGQVAFPAAIATASGQRLGVFTADDTGLIEIARSGQLTPDPTRRFANSGFGEQIAFSDEGDVAFLATIVRADTSQQIPPDSRRALYFYDDQIAALIELARVGDELLGSTISLLSLASTTGLVGDEAGSINNHNQLAYLAGLQDGRSVIILATVPEPSTGALVLGAAAAACFGRRRSATSSRH